MTDPEPQAAIARLQTMRLVRAAYADVLGNLPGLVKLAAPWLVLSWLLSFAASQGVPLAGLAGNVVIMIGIAAVAVAWHRHVLLDAPLEGPYAPVNPSVWRYMLFTIMIGLLVSVPALVAVALAGGVSQEGLELGAAQAIALLAVLLTALWITARLQLVFPGIAINDEHMTMKQSWQLTRGHALRLIIALMALAVPVALATTALTLLFFWIADATGSFIMRALADLASVASGYINTPLVASFLSFAWLAVRDQRKSS